MKGDKNILFVDGSCIDPDYEDSSDVNELIEILCAQIELSDESFIQSDDNLNLLLKLLQSGVIYLAE